MKTPTSHRRPWFLLVMLAVAFLLTSCAAQMVRNRADEKLKAGQYESALAELQAGIKQYPNSTVLRAGLVGAQEEAITKLSQQIAQQRSYGQFDEASKILQRAKLLEPKSQYFANLESEIALDKRVTKAIQEATDLVASNKKPQALQLVEVALREAPRHAILLSLQRRIEGEIRVDNPTLGMKTLAETRPISLDFRNAPLSGVMEAITKGSGINFIFDRDVKQDNRVTVFLRQAKVEDAIDLVLGTQALTRRIVDATTVLIYANTPEKQREHQELIVRVFHLANAEAKTTAALLRSMLKVREPFVDERANLIAIREPADVVALAERLVALHDVGDAEVMLDVEILEVSSTRLTDLGVNYPNSLTLTPLTAAGAATGLTLNDLRGLNGSRIGVSATPLTLNLRREVGDANILANPKIRAKNREKARILIGDKVPVVTTNSSATGIVGQSVNYLEVGLKLDVEPLVSPDEEVTLKIALEVSSITQQISTGNGGTAYQIGTRNASTVLRLRDGETQMLGGLINNAEKSSSARIPGLGDLPILGRLFGSQQDSKTRNELVLAITPRILRAAPRPDLAQALLSVGTEQTPRFRVAQMPATQNVAATPSAQVLAPTPALAAKAAVLTQPTLAWAGGSEVKVGEEFSLTLNLNTDYAVRGVPLEISYSPIGFEVIEVIEGQLLKNNGAVTSFSHAVNTTTGKISVASLRSDSTGTTGKDSLVTLRLRAKTPIISEFTISQLSPMATQEGFTVEQLPVWKVIAR